MQIQQEDAMQPLQTSSPTDAALSAIAYGMDALIPGLYFWCGFIKLRLGGSPAEPTYPGTLHSRIGIALVLPSYRIYSTYRSTYDPD
ncbi:hypothetical protein [Leptolyngbya sp. NIES-2104]|uniref:hypothetical protein n=1 Tax=Leptolyngbya sp. NIES-2104 TaxID=1552121 RepID=UPI0006EC68EA|nr:hypothetical protein [Leptolyngbya sp. NIES-2104]GAP93751.1 hypothetical protein NIES2104_02590 [Leptolyngbya sp. NIES-2104]